MIKGPDYGTDQYLLGKEVIPLTSANVVPSKFGLVPL
jgi:hypothetical protein